MNESVGTLLLSFMVGVVLASSGAMALGEGRRRIGIALMVGAALFAAPGLLRLLAAAWAS